MNSFCHLQVAPEDSDPIISLKEQCAAFIKSKFTPHLLHKVAIFFNPYQKQMRSLSEPDRQLVLAYISDQLDNLPLRAHQPQPTEAAPRAAKRSRFDLSEFDDEPVVEPPEGEVEQYQKFVNQGPSVSILDFWKAHASTFPALSVVARRTLGVMSSSAASERNFSNAGHVVNEKRTGLLSESVDSVLFMNSALKYEDQAKS